MATPQVLILQHVPWERPGRILSNLEDIGLETGDDEYRRQKETGLA